MRKLLVALTLFILLVCVIASAQTGSSAVQSGAHTIRIATINLNDFGYGGETDCKTATKLDSLAQILSEYDVVSCQEVIRLSQSKDNGFKCYGCRGDLCHLDKLVQIMRSVKGQNWQPIVSSQSKNGTRLEYYAILYNADVVTYLGNRGTSESLPQTPPFAAFSVYPPFWAGFRSGNFDFIVIDYHAPTNISGELTKLNGFLDALQAANPSEHDLILAGDLNGTPPLHSPWMPSCGEGLDFIVLDTTFTAYEWILSCGRDIRPLDPALELSNHALIWAAFETTKPDDD